MGPRRASNHVLLSQCADLFPHSLPFQTARRFSLRTFPFPGQYPESAFQFGLHIFRECRLARVPVNPMTQQSETTSLTSSDLPAFISNVESSTLSSDITRAGWPTLVTFSRLSIFATGNASNLSRILSTAKFDAPHTRTRNGLGFAELTEVNWRITSINVWVFPVPAAPSLDLTPERGHYNTWWPMNTRDFRRF